MLQARLGRKCIVFKDRQGSSDHVRETLEREFPKLKMQNGAFEFMRTYRGGASRPLLAIPMQAAGYSILFLRDGIGSGVVIQDPSSVSLAWTRISSPAPPAQKMLWHNASTVTRVCHYVPFMTICPCAMGEAVVKHPQTPLTWLMCKHFVFQLMVNFSQELQQLMQCHGQKRYLWCFPKNQKVCKKQ